jgi:hypothetical protein
VWLAPTFLKKPKYSLLPQGKHFPISTRNGVCITNNFIFFHIPRTGGASFWHSIANSIDHSQMHVLDSAHESLSKFQCPRHEEEVLAYLLKVTSGRPSIIHVHTRFEIPLLLDTKVIMLTRDQKYWKQSLIWAHLNSLFINSHNLIDYCNHPDESLRSFHRNKSLIKCRNKIIFFLRVIFDEFTLWVNCVKLYSVENGNLIRYELNETNQFDLGENFRECLILLPTKPNSTYKDYSEGQHNSHGLAKKIAWVVYRFSKLVRHIIPQKIVDSFYFHSIGSK